MKLYKRLDVAPTSAIYKRLVLSHRLLLIRDHRKRYIVLVMDLRLCLSDSKVVQVDSGYGSHRYPNLMRGACWVHVAQKLAVLHVAKA